MEREYRNQCEAIITHMRRFGSIEPLTALREYGIYRLSGRISDLRYSGYSIKTERIHATSRITGKPVHFAKYSLLEDDIHTIKPIRRRKAERLRGESNQREVGRGSEAEAASTEQQSERLLARVARLFRFGVRKHD